MKLQMFSIYDSKAEHYSTPFFHHTQAVALREFENGVLCEESLISKNPGDFTLFHLGEVDLDKCSFSLNDTPVSLAVAIEFSSSTNN